jgi:L-asparaginase II
VKGERLVDKNALVHTPALFSLNRGVFPEVVVHGFTAAMVAGRLISNDVPSHCVVPIRSTLKPWQLLATIGLITDPIELLACASHSGQPHHLDALARLAQKYSLDFGDLVCPASYPMDVSEQTRLLGSSAAKQRIFHPCSGKHLAYLAAHQRLGGAGSNYWAQQSPVHAKLCEVLAIGGASELQWEIDSCGLPCLVAAVEAMMRLWAQLGRSQEGNALKRIWSKHAELIGGFGRLDTWLSDVTTGQLIAKEGADGILFVTETDSPLSNVVMVKLVGGYHQGFLAAALLRAVRQYSVDLPSVWHSIIEPLQSRLQSAFPPDQVVSFIK